jgi:hypothetical protein
MSDLCTFTANFTTKPETDGILLRQSCKKFGLELHEYGIGEPMPRTWKQAKIVRAIDFLSNRNEKYAMYLRLPTA